MAVFTRDEVAKHNTDDSNWIIIDDKVIKVGARAYLYFASPQPHNTPLSPDPFPRVVFCLNFFFR